MTTHTNVSIAIKPLKHFFELYLIFLDYFIDSRQFLFAPVLSPAARDNFVLGAALICNHGQRHATDAGCRCALQEEHWLLAWCLAPETLVFKSQGLVCKWMFNLMIECKLRECCEVGFLTKKARQQITDIVLYVQIKATCVSRLSKYIHMLLTVHLAKSLRTLRRQIFCSKCTGRNEDSVL